MCIAAESRFQADHSAKPGIRIRAGSDRTFIRVCSQGWKFSGRQAERFTALAEEAVCHGAPLTVSVSDTRTWVELSPVRA
jgi:hypothetical protein